MLQPLCSCRSRTGAGYAIYRRNKRSISAAGKGEAAAAEVEDANKVAATMELADDTATKVADTAVDGKVASQV